MSKVASKVYYSEGKKSNRSVRRKFVSHISIGEMSMARLKFLFLVFTFLTFLFLALVITNQ